jgi:hypothetical protein
MGSDPRAYNLNAQFEFVPTLTGIPHVKQSTVIAVGLGLFTGSLVLVGCDEGTRVAPPSEQLRRDDAFMIPGYNPDAAKSLKKKGRAVPPKRGVIEPRNPRL